MLIKKISSRTLNIKGYISHNIYDRFGILLLAEGTPITDKIIRKLEERDLAYHLILDPLSKYNLSSSKTRPNTFKVPNKLDSKFETIDSESINGATKYLNNVLQQVQKDTFLSNNLKILAKGHKATYSHSINVALISVAIAQKLNIEQSTLQRIALGSLYHDIGKIMLPKSVLSDTDFVNKERLLIYHQHPVLGSDLLASEFLPTSVCVIALQHHERYSGKGYPHGIKENEINLNSAIVAVGDVFDILTSAIFRRDVLSPKEAIHKIANEQMNDFHPQIVKCFIDLLKE